MNERASAAEVLRDLPEALWSELLKGFRRAVETIPRHQLPPELRPFAGWKPDRLLARRPRQALARALATDDRVRERTRDALVSDDDARTAAEMDAGRLTRVHGEARAAAILVVQSRWQELATVAAEHAARQAARQAAAREPDGRGGSDQVLAERAELAQQRKERDALRRRVERLEQRVETVEAARTTLEAELRDARREVEALQEALRDERTKSRDRLARSRRRADEVEARARLDEDRIAALAGDMERLAEQLRDVISDAAPREQHLSGAQAVAPPLPREVPAATGGRPSTLPAGVDPDSTAAVEALLKSPGRRVIVDGYNTTMDRRGKPAAGLEEQRQWLVRLLEGLAARFRCRVEAVFDGTEAAPGPSLRSRAVRVIFSTPEETADDRIVALLRGAPADQPVLVVTGDLELVQRCTELGADLVAPSTFLSLARA